MALLDAGMEAFSSSRLFDDDYEDSSWLETAIKTESNGILDDIKVEHDIWQGGAAAAEPAQQPAAAEPAWPAGSALGSYSGGSDSYSSSGSSTASASPSRMQSDMLDMMGDLDMPACALDLPDCFSGLGGLPELPEDAAFNPDSVRADVMFSSSLSFLDKPPRNRDNSLTLSECADSLFKDLDILGTSPNSSNNLNAFFDTPMASECGSDDTDQEEEEIEVVDNKTIVSNNTTYYVSGSGSKKAVKAGAGRSLLRKNHKKAAPEGCYNDRPRPSTSILESAQLDHCYSTATPPPEEEDDEAGMIPHGALAGSAQTPLTPTASSDDEYERGRHGSRQSLLGKRKHSETSSASMDDGELKFKFRMKFGSSYSPQRRGPGGEGDFTQEPLEEDTAATQQR